MNICVFCGSATGHHLVYSEAARELGTLLGENNHTLVYGGGNIGLMGIVADSTMKAGGKVIGVIPDFLVKREVAHHQLTELIVVDSMHERKKAVGAAKTRSRVCSMRRFRENRACRPGKGSTPPVRRYDWP